MRSVSPKIAIFTTFCFPWGRPWGNHTKCCMDGKRIRCLQITNCLAACAHLTITVWDRARYLWKNGILSYPLAFDAPVTVGSRRNIGTPFGMRKLEWCRYPRVKKISKISLFVLAQLTNVTDTQTNERTDTGWETAYTALNAYAYASRGKNQSRHERVNKDHKQQLSTHEVQWYSRV